MNAPDRREPARPINVALQRTTWDPLIRGDSIRWYGPLLTRLVLLVGDEAVEYATGNLVRDGIGPFSGVISVFTESRVIAADVSGDRIEALGDSTVRTYRRSSLVEVHVESDASVFDDPGLYSWPGTIALEAHYENGDTHRIPGSQGTQDGEQARVRELLTSLLADLTPTD